MPLAAAAMKENFHVFPLDFLRGAQKKFALFFFLNSLNLSKRHTRRKVLASLSLPKLEFFVMIA